MKHALVLSVVAVALAACQTGPVVERDVHTGMVSKGGSDTQVFDSLFSFARARPFCAERQGTRFCGFKATYYSANGNWLHVDQVWSHGQQYQVKPLTANVGSCVAGCTTAEVFVVGIPEDEFRNAATKGFEFEAIGAGGNFVGKIPAKSFAEAVSLLDDKSTAD